MYNGQWMLVSIGVECEWEGKALHKYDVTRFQEISRAESLACFISGFNPTIHICYATTKSIIQFFSRFG